MDLHNYEHSHKHQNNNLKPILITFLLNMVFALLELVGYIFSGSMILYSSFIHDLGDSIALFATFFIEKKANEGRDSTYSYGYRRFTLISTILNYSILTFGSFFAIAESLHKLIHLESFNSKLLIYVSILGIIINLLGYKLVSKNKGISGKALILNLFSDLINFILILISSILISVFDLYILDPIISICFSLYLIIVSISSLKQVFMIIMQAVPSDIDINKISTIILQNKNILNVHDIHIWNLDSEDYILTIHIVVNDNLLDTQIMDIKEQIRHQLEDYNINHSTIEVDSVSHAKYNGEIPLDL